MKIENERPLDDDEKYVPVWFCVFLLNVLQQKNTTQHITHSKKSDSVAIKVRQNCIGVKKEKMKMKKKEGKKLQ